MTLGTGRIAAIGGLLGFALLGTGASGSGTRYVEADLVVNKEVNGVPTLTDKNGVVHTAANFDPGLVNPWGISESGSSPFWISDNGAGTTTLYNTAGQPQTLVVSIPAPDDPLGSGGAPTGQAFNIASAQNAFPVTGVNAGGAATTLPATFLFATEDGTILGWNGGVFPASVPPPPPSPPNKHAIIAVDNSASDAVYKGMAIAVDSTGAALLYATNFRAGTVEVYDGGFHPVNLPSDAFTDRHLPRGYAPFNIVPVTVNGLTELFVSYAKQNGEKKDDVAGQGHGIVNTFDPAGHLLRRFARHGQLDSPWGMALAPGGFGEFGGDLLIGNFGNGHINAYDVMTGHFRGKVRGLHGKAIVIDGLWALKFGNGGNGGDANTLYFTAGPNSEADGLFGSLKPE
jgi:uncharacterized protein (TIGR03118 family)